MYKVGDKVKIHFWTKWVDGEVVKVQPHYREGEVITVNFEGIKDTYQDYELDEIQNKYIEQLKQKCDKEYNKFMESLKTI